MRDCLEWRKALQHEGLYRRPGGGFIHIWYYVPTTIRPPSILKQCAPLIALYIAYGLGLN
jgi:hypothetical protein